MNTEPSLASSLGRLCLAVILATCIGCGGAVDDTPPGQFTLDGKQWSLVEAPPESALTSMKDVVSANETLHETIRTSEPRAAYANEDQQAYRFYWTFTEGDVVSWFFIEVGSDGQLVRMGSGIPKSKPTS